MPDFHTFRTTEGEEAYRDHRSNRPDEGCVLCDNESIAEYTHWRLLKNKFPYDKIAAVHDMLTPKRHVIEPELTQEEMSELHTLKQDVLFGTYEYIIEPARKSFPTHFHIHLIVAKKDSDFEIRQ